MQRGIAVALMALAVNVAASGALAEDSGRHRLYDRQTDCAVIDTAGFPAERASWDGPCDHGLANERGTATFTNHDGISETFSATFEDGAALDGKAEIAWSDGGHYTGTVRDGKPDGSGVLVDAKANRFDGAWKDGALNGRGAVTWSNGDRYEGDWVAGKAEGHGVQVWADGARYDGAWHNDQPNGQGTLTHKDGTSVAGLFVDGKRQAPAAQVAAVAPPPRASAAAAPILVSAPAPQGLDGLAGKVLFGIDGSSVAFTARDGALIRTMIAPDGSMQKTAFNYLGKGLGTISDAGDPPQVGGVFRATPSGIEADYSDGHSETLSPVADGLSIVLKSTSGDQACAAWYPLGHVFSADERKAAVAAYARRLGVSDGGPAPGASCNTPSATTVAEHHPAPMVTPRRKPARMQPAAYIQPLVPAELQQIPIKNSVVHPIDGGDAIATATAATGGDEPIASNCLKIDSDGTYWGFRNHCGYAVQFAYCLLHGTSELTACGESGAVSVPGSVPANGFGALFADDSLAERDVDHNFRWVGCRGGAGEVAAHLDAPDPASGHCVRAGRTLARGN
jgi:hypothetical protein